MRSTWVTLLVLVLIVGNGMAQKKRTAPSRPEQPKTASDQAEIARLQESDIAANMAFDVDGLVALWTDDGVLLAPGHAPISGKTKLRQFYESQRDALGNSEILSYDEQWQEVRIMGEYAYQWGQIRSRTRTGQSKAEDSTVVNALRILKREPDGGWKVTRAIYNEARSGTSVGSEPTPQGEKP